jgi:hypothetical protein
LLASAPRVRFSILSTTGRLAPEVQAGKGLTSQLLNTQRATDLVVVGYGPQLGGNVVQGIQKVGGLVTRNMQLLIDVIKP